MRITIKFYSYRSHSHAIHDDYIPKLARHTTGCYSIIFFVCLSFHIIVRYCSAAAERESEALQLQYRNPDILNHHFQHFCLLQNVHTAHSGSVRVFIRAEFQYWKVDVTWWYGMQLISEHNLHICTQQSHIYISQTHLLMSWMCVRTCSRVHAKDIRMRLRGHIHRFADCWNLPELHSFYTP